MFVLSCNVYNQLFLGWLVVENSEIIIFFDVIITQITNEETPTKTHVEKKKLLVWLIYILSFNPNKINHITLFKSYQIDIIIKVN